ncbi:MAG TPA: YicC family protein [Aeromonadales bacterium]|nr:YicC family protein [Aeromonadales bacterium]
MIRSMTAFSRVEDKADWGHAQIEVRSVNQRFLEVNFRLPETFRYLETTFRQKLRQRISRGKIECQLKFELSDAIAPEIKVNQTLAKNLSQNISQLQSLTDLQGSVDWVRFLQWPDMVIVEAANLEVVEQALVKLFDEAIDHLIESREREGASLKAHIEKRLEGINLQIEKVRAQMPQILTWQKERLLTKFEEAQLKPDSDRVEQELVLMAQKLDVAEEMDRLQTHVEEFYRILKKGGAAGRRMDFLLQEFNREANTLGSKSVNQKTTNASVELKVYIEQIREQIQNIE